MRIWDVSAGYLNRQSLLGEHRELHGLHVILAEERNGYARHPETLRWVDALSGLAWRHAYLAAEMSLRGYVDRTPLRRARAARWPTVFLDAPFDQFGILRRKYVGRLKGRIPLPRNVQELWAHHKYSVMARDPEAYREIGRTVARTTERPQTEAMRGLSIDLVELLREPVRPARLRNALEHMWGYVSDHATADDKRIAERGAGAMLATIQALVVRQSEPYLLASTALSELAVFVD